MRGLPRIQGAVGSRQPHESRQADRCGARLRPHRKPSPLPGIEPHMRVQASGCPSRWATARITRWALRKPTSPSPKTTARSSAPPSAASASAPAATPYGGVMCPSYRATGEEQHSTRGRAHLLWEMLAGALRSRRLPERRRPRGARPLPQLQGLQIGVPGAGGHGRLQVRVSGPALQGPPAPAAPLHLWLCRPASRARARSRPRSPTPSSPALSPARSSSASPASRRAPAATPGAKELPEVANPFHEI